MCANIKLYLRKRKMHIINFCKFRVGIQRKFSLEISCQFCCSMSFLSSRLKTIRMQIITIRPGRSQHRNHMLIIGK